MSRSRRYTSLIALGVLGIGMVGMAALSFWTHHHPKKEEGEVVYNMKKESEYDTEKESEYDKKRE